MCACVRVRCKHVTINFTQPHLHPPTHTHPSPTLTTGVFAAGLHTTPLLSTAEEAMKAAYAAMQLLADYRSMGLAAQIALHKGQSQ